jgi:predicted glycogen debranching enzyme
MSRFNESVCRNLDLANHREWLETNGIGGFSSSTITGLNTRRYHALLTAATRPPVGRMVLLSKLEETLVVEGRRSELSCNRYPGVVHPQGYLYLKEFRQDPFPIFLYEVDGIEIEKSVVMVHGENTTVVEYRSSHPCVLELAPLIAFRDYHATTHQNRELNPEFETMPGMVTCRPYPGLPPLRLAYTSGEVRRTGYWYHNFEYDAERERGLDYREDLFNPLLLRLDLSPSDPAAVIASTEMRSAGDAARLRSAEISRRAAAPPGDQFLVRRGSGSTIIAGYHWFSDWGRDTMISLSGLTLATRRYEEAKSILLAFAETVDQGMLPNRFPDSGEAPEYNTVDATLWFFEAVRALAARTGDYEFVRIHLYQVLSDIVAWHERGTRYGIRLDSDGLLHAGEAGTQLPGWMPVSAAKR